MQFAIGLNEQVFDDSTDGNILKKLMNNLRHLITTEITKNPELKNLVSEIKFASFIEFYALYF